MSDPSRIQRERCDRCGKCCDVCPGNGLRRVGVYYPKASLVEVLLRDSAYYATSGGGVSLSGGECTMFPHFLEGLLRCLKQHNIHVVLETCGYFHYPSVERKILPYVDLIYFDIKIVESESHIRYAGKVNTRILSNFERLTRTGRCDVVPRVPLVPGITATEENLSAIVRFLKRTNTHHMMLLPYNPMGLDKYRSLGRPAPDLPQRFMDPGDERAIYDRFSKNRPGK